MEKSYLKLLNDFANSHVLATEIEVIITDNNKSFKPRNFSDGAKYEDANLLASIIMGAENFCYFLSRNGYKVSKYCKK